MTLYVVATPIGNLEDMTFRAVATLKACEVVIAEDSRRTRGIMTHFDVHTPIVSMPAFRELHDVPKLLERYGPETAIALCTDGGVPVVSDPGAYLVAAARSLGHEIIPIPGASALTAALSVAGFALPGCVFLGFLPRRPGRARKALEASLQLGYPVVIFESPHRLKHLLDLISGLDPTRQVVVARELTKMHETISVGTAAEVAALYGDAIVKGECTVVVQGAA